MRKPILASETRSFSTIGLCVWEKAAIEADGSVEGYMLGKLDKTKKRKSPG